MSDATAPDGTQEAQAVSGIGRFLPIFIWLRSYDRSWLSVDILAAVTLAAFAVPESMAYAGLAGLPPEAGLYACIFAPILYALFGSSRQLQIGPTSALSILVASGLAGIVVADATRYVALAALMAMLVAVICIIAWLLKLGFLVNFISESVLTGFSAGAALYIASTQLGKLFGIPGSSGEFFDRITYTIRHISETNIPSLLIGLGGIVVLLVGERFAGRLPWSLIVVVLSIVLTSVTNLVAQGVAITGTIPAGLPAPTIPTFDYNDIKLLLPTVFAVFLLSYVEGMGAVRTFAKKNNYKTDANQELLALGASSFASGLFQGFPVGGSMSRTAVADKGGAKTPLAGLLAGLLVAVVVLFLTGLFYNLPEPILASVVLVAVRSLFNVPAMRRLYRVSRTEFAVAMVALFGVLLFGMLDGILIAVAVSLMILILRASRPRTVVLGRVPGTEQFGDISRHPENQPIAGVLAFRVDGSLFFANTESVHDALIADVERQDMPVRLVVLDVSASPRLDLAAVEMIGETHRELAARGIALKLAFVTSEARDSLREDGLEKELGTLGPGTSVSTVIEEWQKEGQEMPTQAPATQAGNRSQGSKALAHATRPDQE